MENIIHMKFAQSVKTFAKTFMTPYKNHKEVFQLLKGIMITR